MASKTNAVRLVHQAKIAYREAFYDFDENDLSGIHAAKAIGLPQEQVYKTLVTRGPKTGVHVFCIPVCCELDLKKAAKVAKDKYIEMVQVKELLQLTGYIRGGCSPIGMKKKYVTKVDESAKELMTMIVSGGKIGVQLELKPEDLLKACDGAFADLIVKAN